MLRAWLCLLIVISALAACSRGGGTRGTLPTRAINDTALGVGDVFDVRVFGEEGLSGTYRVAQDGSIDFPLLARVQVEGLEPTEIADVIHSRLIEGRILHSPNVSVLVKEYNSKRITVIGAVAHPGTFPMVTGLTVLQAVSLAGGFTSLADFDELILTRIVAGSVQTYVVDADNIMEGRDGDVSLGAGDTLFIPERIL